MPTLVSFTIVHLPRSVEQRSQKYSKLVTSAHSISRYLSHTFLCWTSQPPPFENTLAGFTRQIPEPTSLRVITGPQLQSSEHRKRREKANTLLPQLKHPLLRLVTSNNSGSIHCTVHISPSRIAGGPTRPAAHRCRRSLRRQWERWDSEWGNQVLREKGAGRAAASSREVL